MAATVVVIRDLAEWEVILNFLGKLEEGGIVVPPAEASQYDASYGAGWETNLDKYVDYDFGGQAEVLVDVARGDNFAGSTLKDLIEEARAAEAGEA